MNGYARCERGTGAVDGTMRTTDRMDIARGGPENSDRKPTDETAPCNPKSATVEWNRARETEMEREELQIWLAVAGIVVTIALSPVISPKVSRGYAWLKTCAAKLGRGATSAARAFWGWLRTQDLWRFAGMIAVAGCLLYALVVGWRWLPIPNIVETWRDWERRSVEMSHERRFAIQCEEACDGALLQYRLDECEPGAIRVARRRNPSGVPNLVADLTAGTEHLRACLKSHGIATRQCAGQTEACVSLETGFRPTDVVLRKHNGGWE